MSNGGVPGEVSLDGSVQVPASPSEGGASTDTTTAADPGDFDARFRGDPEWGLGVYKKLQAEYTRNQQRIKSGDRALQLAQALGEGDISNGSSAMEQLLVQYNAVRSNPKMRTMVDQFLQTGTVPEGGSPVTPDDPDPYEDPRDRELRELRAQQAEDRATLARLEGRTVEGDVEKHMDRFFQKWPLEKHEQAEVLDELQNTFRSYASTPEGRRTLKGLKYQLVETIALQRLSDRLPEIAQRMARTEAQRKSALATDAGVSVRTTGEEAIAGTDLKALMRRKAQELGFDLSKPLTRQ